MSKFRYPKCPYCKTEYKGSGMSDYTLMELATQGWREEAIRKCERCGKKYKITVKIMYWGAKMDGGEHDEAD